MRVIYPSEQSPSYPAFWITWWLARGKMRVWVMLLWCYRWLSFWRSCSPLAGGLRASGCKPNPGRCIRPRYQGRTPFRIESRGCWYTGRFPSSFKFLGCRWQVIRSTPNFVAAKEAHGLRPFTVFRYSLQNDTFGRDFSAPQPVGDFYVSVVGEYTYRSPAIRSLKTLEDQLQSYRKFFGNRR